MLLEVGEVCKHAQICPYHNASSNPCYGTFHTRENTFQCDHVVNGKIVEGGVTIPGDQTGKMKVIME